MPIAVMSATDLPLDTHDPNRMKPYNPTSPTGTTAANMAITRKPVGAKVVNVTRPRNTSESTRSPSPANPSCSQCGAPANEVLDRTAKQNRINELEGEVKMLRTRASISGTLTLPPTSSLTSLAKIRAWLTGSYTADKLADYEEEIQKLKTDRATSPSPTAAQESSRSPTPEPQPPSLQHANSPPRNPSVASIQAQAQGQAQPPQRGGLGRTLTTTRITKFLSTRRAANAPANQTIAESPVSPVPPEVCAQLAREQELRKEAETKLSQTNNELEELSASLFQQANEMVAAERKARVEGESRSHEREKAFSHRMQEQAQSARDREKEAKARTRALEDKVRRLESRVQTLEQRESDRGKRLERLESAMQRVGRLRDVLSGPSGR